MELDKIDAGVFEPHLNKTFTVKSEFDSTKMELVEIKKFKKTYAEGTRDPFSLLFRTNIHIGQGIFNLSTEGIENLNVFMVPVQAPESGDTYCEVVFN